MYFKPYTITIEGKEARVSHMVGNLMKVLYDGKEYLLTLDFVKAKAKWTYKGKSPAGIVRTITKAIEQHQSSPK